MEAVGREMELFSRGWEAGDEGQRGRQGQQLILILVDQRETSK